MKRAQSYPSGIIDPEKRTISIQLNSMEIKRRCFLLFKVLPVNVESDGVEWKERSFDNYCHRLKLFIPIGKYYLNNKQIYSFINFSI